MIGLSSSGTITIQTVKSGVLWTDCARNDNNPCQTEAALEATNELSARPNADNAPGTRESAFEARQYVRLAPSGKLSVAEGAPSVNEVAVWSVILEQVFGWLKNAEQAKAFSKESEALPASAVENARRVFRTNQGT